MSHPFDYSAEYPPPLDDEASARLAELLRRMRAAKQAKRRQLARWEEQNLIEELYRHPVHAFTTTDGERVEVDYAVTIPRGKDLLELAAWLRGQGEEELAKSPTLKPLAAWIRGRLRAGKAIPNDLVEVYEFLRLKPVRAESNPPKTYPRPPGQASPRRRSPKKRRSHSESGVFRSWG